MRVARIGLAVLISVVAQTTYKIFIDGSTLEIDIPLIVVVSVALSSGSVIGMWTGTAVGLLQDVMSGGIVGVSGLAKSIVGFSVGVIGTQFLVTSNWERSLIVVAATVLHFFCFLGVYAVIPSAGPQVFSSTLLLQAVSNGVIALTIFYVVEHAPSVMLHLRRRRGISPRRWRVS